MTDKETLACSLSGPELAERMREWGRVTARATSRRVEKGRIISTYPLDRDLVQQISKLIAQEAACCSFMDFSIAEGEDQLEVEIRMPDEMSDSLESMLGL